ncbi:hypothetical protein O181_050443 [Austropuccinia psidii MF-1]|uniref:Uncharacterized protein n=1 Tax=Austropuccinia psidii MF-1 TaxID=1389203 RepID=A0A9Q3HMD1_9BASI|nr:hypothetical protein [Austropuccinia psidii MF-1]
MVCGPWTIHHGLRSMGAIGGRKDQNGPPGDHELAHGPIFHLHGLDPLRGSRTINILASSKLQGRSWVMNSAPKGSLIFTLEALRGEIIELCPISLRSFFFHLEWADSDILNHLLAYSSVMSFKLTELTESSSSAPPPSVFCGSDIFSQLSSPSMASSGHFDPSQTYDGYKAVERPCRHTGVPTSNVRRYLWSSTDGPFGKGLPGSEAPTPDGTLGYSYLTGSRQRDVASWTNVGGPIYSSSELPISRINTEGVVKRIRRISDSPTDRDAEGSDELDGEEVVVAPHSVDHQSRTSSSQPLANRFQSQVIPSTPRTSQPVLASIPTSLPPDSPSPSHARPALNQAVRP